MSKYIIFLILSCPLFLHAQPIERQVIASGGATAENQNLSLSWTAGEPVAGAFSEEGIYLLQGFQQGELLMDPNGVEEAFTRLQLKIYPNPTSAILQVEGTAVEKRQDCLIRIISPSGRPLKRYTRRWDKQDSSLSINLRALPAGQYFLHISGTEDESSAIISFQKVGVN